jgi:hypothetical protein
LLLLAKLRQQPAGRFPDVFTNPFLVVRSAFAEEPTVAKRIQEPASALGDFVAQEGELPFKATLEQMLQQHACYR